MFEAGASAPATSWFAQSELDQISSAGLLQTIGPYPFALILRIVRAVAEESAALADSEACDRLASFISYSNYKNDKVDALIRDTARTNDCCERIASQPKVHFAVATSTGSVGNILGISFEIGY